MEVFIEAERGSNEKGRYDERGFGRMGSRRAVVVYPYPYGFITGSKAGADGDCADCYVITKERLREGARVECEALGLLEMFEGEEIDHKVIAGLRGDDVVLGQSLRDELEAFIHALFSSYPEAAVRVGRLLPAADALAYLERGQTAERAAT